jgi:hypothetical protein
MIVDWHSHVYPSELAKERRWGGGSPLTIEKLLEAHEVFVFSFRDHVVIAQTMPGCHPENNLRKISPFGRNKGFSRSLP